MDHGQTVYRGRAFLSTTGEPLHYIESGAVTGIESDGVPLVRITFGGVHRFEPLDDGWRADGRDALRDARRTLDAIEQRFMDLMVLQKSKIAERIATLENAGSPAEVIG